MLRGLVGDGENVAAGVKKVATFPSYKKKKATKKVVHIFVVCLLFFFLSGVSEKKDVFSVLQRCNILKFANYALLGTLFFCALIDKIQKSQRLRDAGACPKKVH